MCCLRPPRCVYTGPEVVRRAGMAKENNSQFTRPKELYDMNPLALAQL